MEFQDRTFIKQKDQWFIWEPAWECFRPITAVQWDGKRYVIEDKKFMNDPMNPWYGFGSAEMKALSQKIPYPEKVVSIKTPEIGPISWFRDRKVVLGPCAPQDLTSWKRMCKGRTRTCRNKKSILRNKFTRRNL